MIVLSKICRGCGVKKPIDDYYKHSGMLDGYLNFCKMCVRKKVSARWYKHAAVLRKKEKERHQKRITNPEEKKRRLKYQQGYRTPKTNKAHRIAQRYLERPNHCELCGKECKPEAHHPNYDEPSRVLWCCTVCHRQLHLKLRVA